MTQVWKSLAFAAVGPLLALTVAWWQVFAMTRMDGGARPTDAQIEALRANPSDALLREMRAFAVGADGIPEGNPARVVQLADGLLQGVFPDRGSGIVVGPLSAPHAEFFAYVPQDQKLCSLLISGLLVRAFDITGDAKYLRAALDFVGAWVRFESSQYLPRGNVFNDHATAARAIVMADLWRAYRSSSLYSAEEARRLLKYVRKLARLLRDPALYESRSNHGLMQSLALLHLAIAFPTLDDAAENARIGADRIQSQLPYFLSREGAVLEHSAGYHRHGQMCTAAAGRYLALLGTALSPEIRERYRRGVAFEEVLRRPDGTLPPIGDTRDAPYERTSVAEFDADGRVSQPLSLPGRMDPPAAATLLPAAGYAVYWDGLEQWPGPRGLAQTIMHWANFPARAHKHADELGVSLWADGVQWVTALGFWPYDERRGEAIGWRSSNAPHWLGEAYEVSRSAQLLASIDTEALAALDAVRTNADGSEVRRLLLRPDARTWLVVDSFAPRHRQPAEIIWRFVPGSILRPLAAGRYLLQAGPEQATMVMDLGGESVETIEMDADGTAGWNSGVVSGGSVTKAPALRVLSRAGPATAFARFRLLDDPGQAIGLPPVRLKWVDARHWSLVAMGSPDETRWCRREGTTVECTGDAGFVRAELRPAEQEDGMSIDLSAENRAFESAMARYGAPVNQMLVRRAKVSAVVALTGLLQLGLFLLVRTQYVRWWRPLLIVSSVCWIGLAGFLHLVFLR